MSKGRLFVVPGNHDVNRKRINSHAQATLTRWADRINHALTIPSHQYRTQIQDAVRDSTNTHNSSEYLPHHKCDERSSLKSASRFNSAWSCAGPEDDRTVWLAAEWQFNAARKGIGVADVCIGLIHHPVDWLNEADRDIATRRISPLPFLATATLGHQLIAAVGGRAG